MRLLKHLFPERATPTPSRVLDAGLTYLSLAALEDLDRTVRALEKRQVAGTFIEAGCALGGSALVIAAAKRPTRPFEVYDTFGMIPPPSAKDGADVQRRYDEISSGRSKGIKGAIYYGYQDNLLQRVNDTFRRYGLDPDRSHVRFNPGLFEDTLRIAAPVAFSHIDGDWYESVHCCLSRIEPWLVPGGVLVIDDYDAWSGCRQAVDDYFSEKKSDFDWTKRARLHITRKGPSRATPTAQITPAASAHGRRE